MSGCGSPTGEHIMETCDCGDDYCDALVCIWCEYVDVRGYL